LRIEVFLKGGGGIGKRADKKSGGSNTVYR